MTEPNEQPATVNINFNGYAAIRESTFGQANALPRPRRETGLLDQRDLDAFHPHVPGPNEHQARVELNAGHVVVLYGGPGSGRCAAAVALLLAASKGELHTLSPLETPTGLAEVDYRFGCGYLVDGLLSEVDGPGAEHDWRLLRNQIREAGAFLVITMTAAPETTAIRAIEWVRPPLAEVLRARLGEAAEAAAELLDALGEDCPMRTVAKVCDRVASGEPVTEVLRDLDLGGDEVRGWFATDPGWPGILEVTTLAFSAGVGAEEFEARLAALRSALTARFPEIAEAEPVRSAVPLVSTSDTGVRCFAKEDQHEQVLAELHARQPKLFWAAVQEWITGVLAVAVDLPIAQGLARLAATDLAEVEREYLTPLSRGEHGLSGQLGAAYLVWELCWLPGLAAQAHRIIRDWAESGTATQRQTAALALPGEIGVRYPREAVADLWKLLVASPTEEQDGYLSAVAGLFATLEDHGDDAAAVLDLLRGLLSSATPSTRELALHAVQAVLTVRNGHSEDPVICEFLSEGDAERVVLAGELWNAVLADPAHHRQAMRALMAGVNALAAKPLQQLTETLIERLESTVDILEPEPVAPLTQEPAKPASEPDRYPILEQRWLDPAPRRWPLGRRGRSRPAEDLPRPAPGRAVVYQVDGEQVMQSQPPGPELLRRATQVTVVDTTPDTRIELCLSIPSAQRRPFPLLVCFTATVIDPVAVVSSGGHLTERTLTAHLHDHQRLFQLGAGRGLAEAALVRVHAAAQIQALLEVRPPVLPGLRVRLAGVDVPLPPDSPTISPRNEP